MLENDVLVPLEGDGMLTINSPIWVDGSDKVKPGHAPDIGEHSEEVLRAAGYGEAEIGTLRAAGIVA
jgi:formyl-CoA transferase